MDLTQEQRAKATEWADKYAKPCPQGHGPTKWTIDSPVQLAPVGGGSVAVAGPAAMFIPYTCDECGYTFLVLGKKILA